MATILRTERDASWPIGRTTLVDDGLARFAVENLRPGAGQRHGPRSSECWSQGSRPPSSTRALRLQIYVPDGRRSTGRQVSKAQQRRSRANWVCPTLDFIRLCRWNGSIDGSGHGDRRGEPWHCRANCSMTSWLSSWAERPSKPIRIGWIPAQAARRLCGLAGRARQIEVSAPRRASEADRRAARPNPGASASTVHDSARPQRNSHRPSTRSLSPLWCAACTARSRAKRPLRPLPAPRGTRDAGASQGDNHLVPRRQKAKATTPTRFWARAWEKWRSSWPRAAAKCWHSKDTPSAAWPWKRPFCFWRRLASSRRAA